MTSEAFCRKTSHPGLFTPRGLPDTFADFLVNCLGSLDNLFFDVVESVTNLFAHVAGALAQLYRSKPPCLDPIPYRLNESTNWSLVLIEIVIGGFDLILTTSIEVLEY
jgi:hypothetical protein